MRASPEYIHKREAKEVFSYLSPLTSHLYKWSNVRHATLDLGRFACKELEFLIFKVRVTMTVLFTIPFYPLGTIRFTLRRP